jgi:23S rRNA (adenine2503-C2)-methyltransferase
LVIGSAQLAPDPPAHSGPAPKANHLNTLDTIDGASASLFAAQNTVLFGQSQAELVQVMARLGQKPYRATQLAEALYRQRVESLDAITTLPANVREQLQAEGYHVGLPQIVQTARSIDGTERYLMRMADGETVETVWMPNGDGGERGDGTVASDEESAEDRGEAEPATSSYKRATICISSQVGCAVNCQFCLTAKLGIRRNLTAGEIAGQVAAVLNRQGVVLGSSRGNPTPARINLVFMGMGEPFLNYSSFIAAVHLLNNHMQIPDARMTVSTSGILPGILSYAAEEIRPKLAISLNASNDVVRESIMPITRKWDIAALMEALGKVRLRAKECVTFEYVLLGGINDQPEHSAELIALLKAPTAPLRSKVNLIVWNSGPSMPFEEPAPATVAAFHSRLLAAGIPTFTRRPRGRDIYAACGQLKRTLETQPVPSASPLVSIAQ